MLRVPMIVWTARAPAGPRVLQWSLKAAGQSLLTQLRTGNRQRLAAHASRLRRYRKPQRSFACHVGRRNLDPTAQSAGFLFVLF